MCLHLGGFSKGEEKYIFGKMQFIGALIKLSFDIQVVGGDAKPRRPPVWHPRHRCSEDSKCIYANPLTPEAGELLRLLGLPFCLGFPVSGTEGVWTLAVKAHLSFFRTPVASPPTGISAV